LRLAAAAEGQLKHPVARAIVAAATKEGLVVPDQEASRYAIGQGICARVGGSDVHVGSTGYMTRMKIDLQYDAVRDCRSLERDAISSVWVSLERTLIGLIGYADEVRPETPQVLHKLRRSGMGRMIMLTGDQIAVGRRTARQLGIKSFAARLLPHEKLAYIKSLQRRGFCVAVVGDGINDSPALSHADVGIAVSGGADLASESADVVLLNGDLTSMPLAVDCAREALQVIEESWRIISIPNTFALLLACLGQLGPGAATLLSNGAAVVSTAYALRPLFKD
jgi:Cu2+-exporting ATPase